MTINNIGMAEISLDLSDKLTKHLIGIARIKNYDLSELFEEALMNYYNISLLDFNSIDEVEIIDDIDDIDDIDELNYENYIYILLNKKLPGNFKYNGIEEVFKYEPFYVGKGKNNRHEVHLIQSHNEQVRKNIEINGDPEILIYKNNLSEEEAYNLEYKLIHSIGRKDIGKGPLYNITSGLSFRDSIEKPGDLSLSSERSRLIINALNKHKTIKKAAEELKISQRTLYRKIKNLKIIRDDSKNYYFESEVI